MSEKDILINVRKLFVLEKNWCKGNYATDNQGCFTEYSDDSAHSFCLVGALYNIGERYDGSKASESTKMAFKTLQDIVSYEFLMPLVDFNDAQETTFEDMLGVIDKAIEIA